MCNDANWDKYAPAVVLMARPVIKSLMSPSIASFTSMSLSNIRSLVWFDISFTMPLGYLGVAYTVVWKHDCFVIVLIPTNSLLEMQTKMKIKNVRKTRLQFWVHVCRCIQGPQPGLISINGSFPGLFKGFIKLIAYKLLHERLHLFPHTQRPQSLVA